MSTAITNKQQNRNRTQTRDIHFKTSTWKSLMDHGELYKRTSKKTYWSKNLACYNQLQKYWDTPTKKRPSLLQIAPGQRSGRYNTDLLPPFHSKLLLQVSFEYGVLLLATLIRGGGGIKSTRSWTGYLCQNTVQCLKLFYFCNWLSHLRFTLTSDFHVLNSLNEDYSDIFPADISLSLRCLYISTGEIC